MNRPVVKINNIVQKHTSAIDVEKLHRRGVTRINTITLSKINRLVTLAVQKAFEKYQLEWSRREAARVETEARREVHERLDLGSPPGSGEAAADGARGAREEIRQLAQAVDREARELGGDAESRRIELLERRVEKLKEHLSKLEAALKDSETRNADPGIPSVYRSIQGLDAKDQNFARKHSVLKSIFEDNARMQWNRKNKTPAHG